MVISQALRLKPLLLTADPSMLSALRSAMSVAASQVPVILSGEIGAGKYNFARIIHSASRCGGPLHSLSCASLQDVEVENLVGTLPASEGHAGSVLFLDEIAELTDGAQLKLLQILQALERTPLLQERERGASMRFVAATNRALATMVERGEFRRELFWRLNVFSLAIPPLRQRAGDVAILAKLFLRRANPRRMFTPMALRVMGSYAFPGNVMELENLVTRLAIAPLGTGNSLIDVPDVRRHLMVVPAEGEQPTSGWKSSREEARRAMILKTIAAAGGNRAEAARRLGITTRALQYHITKAGLSRPSVRAKPAMSRPGATVFHRATPMQDEPTTAGVPARCTRDRDCGVMIEEDDHPAHPDERWLVSYADFITLLFALFVLLYALSNSSKAKEAAGMNSVAKAVGMRPTYGMGGGTRPGMGESPGKLMGSPQLAAAKAAVEAAVKQYHQFRCDDDHRFARAGDLALGRKILSQWRRSDHSSATAGPRRAGQDDGGAPQHISDRWLHRLGTHRHRALSAITGI